jgi:hypothetical protein
MEGIIPLHKDFIDMESELISKGKWVERRCVPADPIADRKERSLKRIVIFSGFDPIDSILDGFSRLRVTLEGREVSLYSPGNSPETFGPPQSSWQITKIEMGFIATDERIRELIHKDTPHIWKPIPLPKSIRLLNTFVGGMSSLGD